MEPQSNEVALSFYLVGAGALVALVLGNLLYA